MDVPAIAKIAFTSEDRVQRGDPQLQPGRRRLAGLALCRRGRPSSAGRAGGHQRIALGRAADYGEPFSTWSLTKLAAHLVRKGLVEDISHEGLRALLREEGFSLQAIKTWKESNDPDFNVVGPVKKNRILELDNSRME